MLSIFSLFSGRPLFPAKDPVLQNIRADTRHKILSGKYAEAAADLTAALRTDSLNPTLYHLRGACRRRLHALPAAVSDFSRCIQLDSSHDRAYAGRGDAQFELQHSKLAHDDYVMALNRTHVYMADADLMARLGATRIYLNELPQALIELEGAVALDLRNDFALYYLTVARTMGNQKQAAAASAKEYIKWHVKRPEGYINRALLNCTTGNFTQANADIKFAQQLAPADTATALATVVITESYGHPVEAQKILAVLLAGSAHQDELYLDLADRYLQIGSVELAKKNWTLAAQLGSSEANSRLAAGFKSQP